MKNAQNAKMWLLGQFSKFYLIDKLNPLVESLTEENFVTELSNFVVQNKDFAEAEIRKNNPDIADTVIAELNSLNYVMLKDTYFMIYNQPVPIPPNYIPQNFEGQKLNEWLRGNVNVFNLQSNDIFAGGLDLNLTSTKMKIQASFDALTSIQNNINDLKAILEAIK